MPWSRGFYSSPNTGPRPECTCYLSIDDDTSSEHSSSCAVSLLAVADLRGEIEFGASLAAFAHEWDASARIEDAASGLDASRDIHDYPELTGHLVAALLEEQRTANLIAIANGGAFALELRERARDAVLERLDVQFDRGEH